MARGVKISYNVGNSLKPAIPLSVGQWWLYRDSKKWDWPELPSTICSLRGGLQHITDKRICAVVIVDLTLGVYGGEEVKVEFMVADDKYCPYSQHEMAWFVDQNFSADEGYFTPFWTPVGNFVYQNVKSAPASIKYGANCMKCKQHYPHAIREDGFTCWSCRHGY